MKDADRLARQTPQGQMMQALSDQFTPAFAKIGSDEDHAFVRKVWHHGRVAPEAAATMELYVGGQQRTLHKYRFFNISLESWEHFFQRGLKKAGKMSLNKPSPKAH